MPLFSNEKYEISSQSAERFRCAISLAKSLKLWVALCCGAKICFILNFRIRV
jgi:hypothetical protein